jgi:DNA-binding NtrC family response regulator
VSPAAARVLLAEDNEILRRGMALALREAGYAVEEAAAGDAALLRLRDLAAAPLDVVIADLRLPRADGIALLRAARERDPRPAVLIVTAFGSIEAAVEAMRHGAFDFVQKPVSLEQLELRVARAVEHVRAQRVAAAGAGAPASPPAIVGASPALCAAIELARRAAPTRSTVLLTGETGTGKELVAGLIHAQSKRGDRPFVKVNCAALPETLLESELFGHERGAFTGADRARVGRFEQADGGSLFLDEVGDMSGATQAKLLRVLQEREFHRLGGTRVLRSDVRIVAATNQDLEAAVAAGRFREDLFFRLHVIAIHLPALRERGDDVVRLAAHLLAESARELGRPRLALQPAALDALRAHPWPGNVRELRNVIERAALMAEGESIGPEDLALGCDAGESAAPLASADLPLAELERAAVLAALRRSGFVQKDAAARLGVTRRKLNYMIRKMGITHASWRRNRGGEADGEAGGPAGPPLDSPADAH